jgi:hypothetical protein
MSLVFREFKKIQIMFLSATMAMIANSIRVEYQDILSREHNDLITIINLLFSIPSPPNYYRTRMLQPHTTYNDTNKIAHDAYKISETLGRTFKVHKNDSSKHILRCRDCGAASCFSVRATSSVVDDADV